MTSINEPPDQPPKDVVSINEPPQKPPQPGPLHYGIPITLSNRW
jgi:hypothetical protein